MNVKIIYLGLIRRRIGKKEEEIDISDNSFLSDLIEKILRIYDMTFDDVFSYHRGDSTDPSLIITVNGILKEPSRSNEVLLQDGDIISFMNVISGG